MENQALSGRRIPTVVRMALHTISCELYILCVALHATDYQMSLQEYMRIE